MAIIAGKSSEIVGNKDSTLILRGSSVKIQWGNKFIDLIKNGKIAAESEKILKVANSEEELKSDGIYLIDESVWMVLNGAKVQLTSENPTYISYFVEQELNSEQKSVALKNIGFYYDSLEDVDIKAGLVYILGENKVYLVKDGVVSEFKSEQEINTDTPVQSLQIEDYSLVINGEQYITCNNDTITMHKQSIFEDGIYSPTATDTTGYRLYIKNGKSHLDIDYVNARYEEIKESVFPEPIHSRSTNFMQSKEQYSETQMLCTLKYGCKYEVGWSVFVMLPIIIDDIYENNTLILTTPFILKRDLLVQTSNGNLTILKDTKELRVPNFNAELWYIPEKQLQEYKVAKILNDENQILLDVPLSEQEVFLKYATYLYDSVNPLIVIENNNLDVIDRSRTIKIDNKEVPDHYFHTRVGIINTEEEPIVSKLTQLNEVKEIDKPDIGVYSDNFIGLNPLLYNSIFKSAGGLKTFGNAGDLQRFPEYENITIPKPSLGNPGQTEEQKKIYLEKELNQVVPNIEWIKALIDFAIPIGTIVAWSGKIDDIPKGWAICSELQDKFIVGSNENKASTVGTTIDKEGKIQVDIESKHLPNHVHNVEDHGHMAKTIVTVNDYQGSASDSITDDYRSRSGSSDSGSGVRGSGSLTSETETITIDLSHGHLAGAVTTITDKTGLKTANDRNNWGDKTKLDITPTYYKLIFIKKVSSSFE